jgi:hypothetical protein
MFIRVLPERARFAGAMEAAGIEPANHSDRSLAR